MICLLLVVRNVNSYHNIKARAYLRASIVVVSVSVGALCQIMFAKSYYHRAKHNFTLPPKLKTVY